MRVWGGVPMELTDTWALNVQEEAAAICLGGHWYGGPQEGI